MNGQPAFELKSFPTSLVMLEVYRRLQLYVAGPARPWTWLRSRRVRNTLTVRQLQQRLQLDSTPHGVRHVCLDVIPTARAASQPVRRA